MQTVLEIIKKTTDFFAAKQVESPRLNAELLIGHALGLKRMQLYLQFERPLNDAELDKIRPLVRRRGQREPLQYILGETDFLGLRLKVDRRALIPRPETELLVERIRERLTAPPARILDLGTGTGAIALVLAQSYPDAQATGVDLSTEALALAAENAQLCALADRVTWREGSWFAAIGADETFDLIVSNPPYLSPDETAAAEPEVRAYEPVTALTGAGADGRGDLSAIIADARAHLNTGGLLALETGIAQHAALMQEAQAAGYTQIESAQDLTGRDRFIFARR
ncbi:MAG: peptide chain release factor N(5)-glutamine methyltransferase [Verrucomicrobia bacterium]|nr:peptide chain release factor N(5)-glutamine methyltransferase [Verrucomicrobiota bacterium]